MKEFAFRIHVFENQTNDPIVFENYLQKEENLMRHVVAFDHPQPNLLNMYEHMEKS